MAVMVRKQIYIEPQQDRALKRLAKENHTTEAAVIRDLIRRHVDDTDAAERRRKAWEKELAFIRARAKQGPVPGPPFRWSRQETYDR